MRELGIPIEDVLPWFSDTDSTTFDLVRVDNEHAAGWSEQLRDALRRCYVSDEFVRARSIELETQLGGALEEIQALIIMAKMPDAGSTMAGDFGEILGYMYLSAAAHPATIFGPKKWRLKQDRNKPAPGSDVVAFALPDWPNAGSNDAVFCAEVKTKSTSSSSTPIHDAIADCSKDQTSRLSKTLVWLRERALCESLGEVDISHLDRFINSIDHPIYKKEFFAIVVICASLIESELSNMPNVTPDKYRLIIISVPNLHTVYTNVFDTAKIPHFGGSRS